MGQLIVLAVILLILYAVVRAVATAVSALTGARYRAYRQLATRYRGRYENRGLVDPPTVSFLHNGTSVRVGLAPVVAGQASLPRTRVVARFASGLPVRLELQPAARPLPPQPPKGTRPVKCGHDEFDRHFLIQANDPEIARAFLGPLNVRTAIDSLRKMAPPAGMLLSINPERLLIQVDRNLGQNAMLLDFMVRDALIIHDWLQASVSTRLSDGIEIVAAGPAEPHDAGAPMCTVCRDPIGGEHVRCSRCRTPYHRDCWTFIGACSTFACSSKQCDSA